jgi:hypothetical protein
VETIAIRQTAAANAVVQNDKTVTPVAKATPVTLVGLEDRRKAWETTVYRTSNQQLYALLGDCYAYGADLPIAEAKQRTADLEKFFELRGYTVKKDSPLLTRVVKAVFGNVDRRRISTYSLVLRSAKAAGVAPSGLAQWIEDQGGIQEVKLTRSATYVSPKAKAQTAKASLATITDLAVVKSPLLSQKADADFIGTECVLLAEQQADGSFVIKAVVRTGTAVNAALTAVYAEQHKAAA